MHVGEIITADCTNGPGVRVSIFVSGCTNCCKGCFQPETWDFNFGRKYTEETREFILKELQKPYYDGVSILGGEPFEPSNQKELVSLIRDIKDKLPELSIWMYTGNTLEKDLVKGGAKYTEYTDEILKSIDVLVDGRFVEKLKDYTLNYRGSKNQRIIDMRATLASDQIVLSDLNN